MTNITTIDDPSIKLIASKKMCQYIWDLDKDIPMPENIIKIYTSKSGRNGIKLQPFKEKIENIKYTAEEEAFLKGIEIDESVQEDYNNLIKSTKEGEDSDEEDASEKVNKRKPKKKRSVYFVTLSDCKWLYKVMKEARESGESEMYLHELIFECELVLPRNEVIERNPELEARCQRLKREQEEWQYHKMTRNVDNSMKTAPEDTISYQIKVMNRQLIAVAQFIFSVAAGFAFGFIGIELIVGDLDFGFRLLLGIIIALIIALAEIYFLAKKLNEDVDDVETVKKNVMKKNTGQSTPLKTGEKAHKE